MKTRRHRFHHAIETRPNLATWSSAGPGGCQVGHGEVVNCAKEAKQEDLWRQNLRLEQTTQSHCVLMFSPAKWGESHFFHFPGWISENGKCGHSPHLEALSKWNRWSHHVLHGQNRCRAQFLSVSPHTFHLRSSSCLTIILWYHSRKRSFPGLQF